MSEPKTPAEWIEHHRQARVAEGLPLEEQAMITALAEVVIIDKINRARMGPANDKGRSTFIFEGEPTEAEQHWAMLQEQYGRKEPRE